MQLHRVAAGLDPDDVVDRDQHDMFLDAYGNALQEVFPLAQGVERLQDPRRRLRTLVRGKACLRAPERIGEAFAAERLDQVVDGIGFERAHRVLLVGGDEDRGRHARRADRGHHVQAGDRRHLDVEEDQVGRLAADRFHRGHAVAAFAQQLDLRILAQQSHDRPARDRLVVDDEGGDPHAGTGSVASATSPIARNGSRTRQATPCGHSMSSRTSAASA